MLSEPIEQSPQAEDEGQPQDEDSLFGSPPPSPTVRGRSPSPALALPSAIYAGPQSSVASIALKVGTIALPGSHTNSELPHSHQDSVRRNESSSAPLAQLPLSAKIGRNTSQLRKQGTKRKLKPPSPRPPPPAIPLPDPSEPPPAHFLRNQQALLGHAGLIARVKPSKLATNNSLSRGTSPSNPIVLDDNEGEVFYQPSAPIGRSTIEYFKTLDRSRLPTPTIQEVTDTLIKQKDIFPVLQSILRLLAYGAAGGHSTPAPTTSTRGWISRPIHDQQSFPPPVKRRKLNRVPAGAADWDVPYPFPEGEGPKAYRQNWTKARGRQLVSQLVSLVKSALEKAAAKKHFESVGQRRQEEDRGQDISMMNQQEGGRGANHYRDERVEVSSPKTSPGTTRLASVSPATASLSPPPQTPGNEQETVSTKPDDMMFNDLFSALLSSSGGQCLPSGSAPPQSSPPSDSPEALQSTYNPFTALDLSSAAADQSLIDSWMSILQTFPLPADGHTTSVVPSFTDASLESFFGIDTPSDLSSFASPTSHETSSFSTTPNPDTQQPPNFPTPDHEQAGNMDLLGLAAADAHVAIPGKTHPSTNFTFELPLSSPSIPRNDPINIDTDLQHAYTKPMPMEVDDLEPISPIPADWDTRTPHVAAVERCQIQDADDFVPSEAGDGIAFKNNHARDPAGETPAGLISPESHTPTLTPPPVAPIPPQPSGVFSVLRVEDLQPRKPRRKLNKADVLKKAEEKRAELMGRLEQVKVKLWEATIEHGALLQMLRMSEEEERSSTSSTS